VPTAEGCRFDTSAPYLGQAMGFSRTAAAAGVRDFTADLTRREGRPSASGPAADYAERARQNREMFCDLDANGGNPGCAEDAGPYADAHVLPSRTIFGAETIDLQDARALPAVNELVRNMVGYRPPPPAPPSERQSAAGREARMMGRASLAQMDASAGLLWGAIGDRLPAGAAPEVEQMRLRIGGSQPSARPSEYEIRQQIVEQLWDPAYYANLQDAAATTRQKQVYLRAYSVMQMYKLIEKMERVAGAYAIQAANMVDRTAGGLQAQPGGGGAVSPPAAGGGE
jgi:hypothetical protein